MDRDVTTKAIDQSLPMAETIEKYNDKG